jgi:hypothetical protein
MENLTINELVSVNGGSEAPKVSNDPAVQDGYGVGWYVGRVLGSTIRQVKSIFDLF